MWLGWSMNRIGKSVVQRKIDQLPRRDALIQAAEMSAFVRPQLQC